MHILRLLALVALTSLVASCGSSSDASSSPAPPPVVAVTPKGDPTGAPTQSDIGPGGGQVVSSDGFLTVVVPPGALAATTTIAIQPIANRAPGGIRDAYRLGPDGQTFAVPVQLVFTYADEDIVGSSTDAFRAAYQAAAGSWVAFPPLVVDAAANRMTATSTHFTDVVITHAFSIQPPRASLQPGQSTSIVLEECTTTASKDKADLLELTTCSPTERFIIWGANGVHGGDANNGIIDRFEHGKIIFTAPQRTPAKNPVEVTAELTVTDATGDHHQVYSAFVDVGGHGTWVGASTVTVTQDFPGQSSQKVTTVGAVTWTWDEGQEGYVPAGTVTYDFESHLLGAKPCDTNTHYSGLITTADGNLQVGGGMYSGSGFVVNSVTVAQVSNCNDEHVDKTEMVPVSLLWWQGGSGDLEGVDQRTIHGESSMVNTNNTQTTYFKFEKH